MTTVISPIDGSVLQDVPAWSSEQLDAGFRVARHAQRAWRALDAGERGRILGRVAEGMRARADELAHLETRNMGMPLEQTRAMAMRAAGTFEYFGGYADKLVGEVIPVPGAFHTYTRREPHGIVVAIVPWNAPLIFAAKKLAPALAFGNACLLKPAEETPLTALALREIMDDAGVPHGVAQVVTGGREAGERLVGDPRADLVVFTGSHETGRAVARAAAEHLTPVALELGGKSPQVVFADADLERAVEGVVDGVFGECGQMCIAGSRLLVQEGVHDRFLSLLATRTAALRVGDPLRPGTEVGPQTTPTQRDKTLGMMDRAMAEGARVVAQAPLPSDPALAGGYWVAPTAFTDVTRDAELMREEVFGPVLAVTAFTDEEDAARMANDTAFGLAAGVWTRDGARAQRMAAAIDAGTIWLNSYAVISDLVPFGGIGRSGFGREGGSEAAALYTRVKSVWTALAP